MVNETRVISQEVMYSKETERLRGSLMKRMAILTVRPEHGSSSDFFALVKMAGSLSEEDVEMVSSLRESFELMRDSKPTLFAEDVKTNQDPIIDMVESYPHERFRGAGEIVDFNYLEEMAQELYLYSDPVLDYHDVVMTMETANRSISTKATSMVDAKRRWERFRNSFWGIKVPEDLPHDHEHIDEIVLTPFLRGFEAEMSKLGGGVNVASIDKTQTG